MGNAFWVVLVDDDFIKGLFEIIEDLSYDASDPYHYPVIRVLVRICLIWPCRFGLLLTRTVVGFQRAVHDFSA
jgi:hypothetical protein